jgi:pimeloyl-ACP methyl ester carboxylesterase
MAVPADSNVSERFFAAYDEVLAGWPVPHEAIDVPGEFGTTRVNACGPPGAAPLVLLPGGGATSTVWFANVADLSREYRVFAVDTITDAGRSVPDGRPITRPAHLMTWLDGLLTYLRIGTAHLAGHSYGGWLALSYALHAPQRVERLALLDPTRCFAGLRPAYVRHALPSLVRPSEARMRSLIHWETGGLDEDLNPAWLRLMALGAVAHPPSTAVTGRIDRYRLAASATPTSVLLAGGSRAHDIAAVERNARRRMPAARVTVLPSATHHTLPMWPAPRLNATLLDFFRWREIGPTLG